ncbi:hypothetical protein POVCU2_0037920 [Plasmodium ovale curtisi]|uniref:Uncharacterized protein n=1 Tax=Plasmodium ovale curtisi TaxID=864141 RepID=A0A1A8W3K9_PLAOA|nr:hypothetical protein POVCU2_0037920 [Plasmodium ovale curtisi]SBS96980.1 hypothetical protein POVCU1_034910 [Plasmodium ovale curtisi]
MEGKEGRWKKRNDGKGRDEEERTRKEKKDGEGRDEERKRRFYILRKTLKRQPLQTCSKETFALQELV